MLTSKDIINLITVFKEHFYSKEEINVKFDEVHLKFDQLQTSVDGLVKNILVDNQEIPALGNRVDTVEKWVKKATPKIGLEYKP